MDGLENAVTVAQTSVQVEFTYVLVKALWEPSMSLLACRLFP